MKKAPLLGLFLSVLAHVDNFEPVHAPTHSKVIFVVPRDFAGVSEGFLYLLTLLLPHLPELPP